MAIQSDSPTQPLGVHGVGVGLVLGRQFSLGQSAGGVYWAQQGGGGIQLIAAKNVPYLLPPRGWIQKGPPGGRGRFVNPAIPRLTLFPDLNHGPPEGPHYDIEYGKGMEKYKQKLRVGPQGKLEAFSRSLGWIILEEALTALLLP